MKKFLKVFIIVLLVAGVIGATIFFFFRHFKQPATSKESLIAFAYENSINEFNNDLSDVNSVLTVEKLDVRFEEFSTTSENLKDSASAIIEYMIIEDSALDNDAILSSLNSFKSSLSKAKSMMNEFEIKSTSPYFNKSLGANDLYAQVCDTMVKHARFVSVLNREVTKLGINTNSDIKFAMIDVYTRAVINDFSSVKTLDGLTMANSLSNITFLNDYYSFDGLNFNSNISKFDIQNNEFLKYYNDCNKDEFAKLLSVNVATVNSVSSSATNEKNATYYFKVIVGA